MSSFSGRMEQRKRCPISPRTVSIAFGKERASSPPHRLRVVFEFLLGGHREIEAMIAEHARLARALGEELELSHGALDALSASYERWDGRGWPGDRRGAEIPIAARVIQLAHVVRELRGGLHIVAVLASGLSPLEAVLSGTSAIFADWSQPSLPRRSVDCAFDLTVLAATKGDHRQN